MNRLGKMLTSAPLSMKKVVARFPTTPVTKYFDPFVTKPLAAPTRKVGEIFLFRPALLRDFLVVPADPFAFSGVSGVSIWVKVGLSIGVTGATSF